MELSKELEKYGKVLVQEPLKKHTTYKIGGPADYYIYPNSLEDFQAVLSLLKREDIPWFVLGKGSNVLVGDHPWHGAVICLDRAFSSYEFQDDILYAQAGCSLIALAFEAQKHSLSGLEFAAGIPGSLGGGLYMNAGAYRSDLSRLLMDVQVLRDGKVEWVSKEDLDYQYRHSAFQKHKDWIILAARLKMEKGDPQEIQDLMDSRKKRRQDSQPLEKPCAGSVFRNPENMNAWKIIDELGYRGKIQGGACVSGKHSNFIVNETGDATAADVSSLIEQIQKDAREKLGVELITEVERINWDEEA
ncbi:MAG: UDP-N-acetylmuramate dehydrogenase [Erysipelotrichaceae bacterium]|nr:UDP-N-acetylmuramate dehydrogenase [Erysipelotrichaceae bacterium]